MSEAKSKFSPLGQFSRRVVRYFLLCAVALIVLIGQFQSGHAQRGKQVRQAKQTSQTQPKQPAEKPKNVTITPATAPPDGIVTLNFGEDVTPSSSSVKIGNLDASIVSESKRGKTFDIKIPSGLAQSPQTVTVTTADPPQTFTGSLTIGPVATAINDVIPKIVQPGGMMLIVFNKHVTTRSVQIGSAHGAYDISPTHRLFVTLPMDVPMGRQNISVSVAGDAEPLTAVVTVAPLVLGLQPNKDNNEVRVSGVVVEGGEFMVKLSDKIPSAIKPNLVVRLVNITPPPSPSPTSAPTTPSSQQSATQSGEDAKPCKGEDLYYTQPQDDYLLVEAPKKTAEGTSSDTTYALRICVGDSVLQNEIRIHVQDINYMYLRASIVTALLILLLYIFYRISRWVQKKRDQSEGKQQQPYYFLKMLLLEPENQTYSLSRAQFLSWLFVIVWCYLFIYLVHGYVGLNWSYPALGTSIYAFLISLGTLIAAQVTNRTVGVKGAGEEHPSVADLVVHGGVLALDRVQQVVWTLITLGMFVRITVSTFATAKGLPDIPNDLLMLMGLSSAGYLGGKIVRGAGPVIDDVTASEGSLIVKGKHLSKDAFVWLDGAQVKKKIEVTADDPDDPTNFASELKVPLDLSLADWWAQEHAITVINDDAQRADWRTTAKIVSVTPGEPSEGKVTLMVKSAYARKGAATVVVKDTSAKSKQDESNPNLFTVSGVPADWVNSPHDVTIKSGDRESTFKYTPATTGGGDEGAGGAGGDQGAGGAGGAADDQGAGAAGDQGAGAAGDQGAGAAGDQGAGAAGDQGAGTAGDQGAGAAGDQGAGAAGDQGAGAAGDQGAGAAGDEGEDEQGAGTNGDSEADANEESGSEEGGTP